MKSLLKIVLGILLTFALTSIGFGQSKSKKIGPDGYQKYDKSYITPTLRVKHSISLGGYSSVNRPVGDLDPQFEPAFHIGYNYLVLNKRKYTFSKKGKFTTEIKLSFGAHLTMSNGGEIIFNLNCFKPLIAIKGRLLEWYILSEYGVGLHKLPDYYGEEQITTPNLSFETLRIRFFRSRLFLHQTFNIDMRNNYLSKQRANWGAIAGLRYYI